MNEINKKSTIPQGVTVDQRLINVKRIKETKDVQEANTLLKQGWIMIFIKDDMTFWLGLLKA